MTYPETKEEWWESVEKHWDNIENLVLNFYPNQASFPEKGWPANNTPQAACNQIVQELRAKHPIWKNEDFFKAYLGHLKETKDKALDRILQSTWFGMPENPSVRELPGFFEFCDLCSESYLLYRKEEDSSDSSD